MTPAMEFLLFGVATIELVVEPALEGVRPRWRPLNERTLAVAPSLWRELEELVPEASTTSPLEQCRGS